MAVGEQFTAGFGVDPQLQVQRQMTDKSRTTQGANQALRYDGTRPAPEVVAKGQDLVAAAIREEAAKHEVPVMSNPPLARALYREVELGQQIPDDFFAVVAEVLAFVYRTAGRRTAARRRQLAA